MKKGYLAFFGVLIIAFKLHAAGGVGADFLRIDPSAKTAAMSGAYAGCASDINSIYYNPAGLINIKDKTLTLSHFANFSDTNFENLGGAMPFGPGVAGVSLLVDYTFDFPHYNEWGQVIGNVDAYDAVLGISYAYPVSSLLSAGMTIKGFYSSLAGYDKSGFAFDAGLLVKLGSSPDTFGGVMIQNVGTQDAYIEVADPLPMNLKVGLSTSFKPSDFAVVLLCVDVNRLLTKDEMPTLDIGAEVVIGGAFAVRAGYGLRHDKGNLALGVGINMEKVRFSYAFQPFDELGACHRISLDLAIVSPENNEKSGTQDR